MERRQRGVVSFLHAYVLPDYTTPRRLEFPRRCSPQPILRQGSWSTTWPAATNQTKFSAVFLSVRQSESAHEDNDNKWSTDDTGWPSTAITSTFPWLYVAGPLRHTTTRSQPLTQTTLPNGQGTVAPSQKNDSYHPIHSTRVEMAFIAGGHFLVRAIGITKFVHQTCALSSSRNTDCERTHRARH